MTNTTELASSERAVARQDEANQTAQQISNDRVAKLDMDGAAKFAGAVTERSTGTKIKARIGDEDASFQIAPDDLPAFEAINGSAYEALLKLTNGSWTVDLLRKVLTFAAMPDKDRAVLAKMGRMGIGSSHMVPSSQLVNRVLRERPVAVYAGLAALVLTGALLGISEDEATFTDEPEAA